MAKSLTAAMLGLVLAATAATAGSDGRWLHVAVDGDRDERVRVNVPMSLVAAVLPLIEEEEFRHGRIHFDGNEFSHADLVEILRAVRDAEDGQYVTVEGHEDQVHISKRDGMLFIRARENRHDDDQVDVRIPMTVLDALLSGEEDELDLVAAIEALADHGSGDIVTVNDEGSRVRIWIDDRNVPEGEE